MLWACATAATADRAAEAQRHQGAGGGGHPSTALVLADRSAGRSGSVRSWVHHQRPVCAAGWPDLCLAVGLDCGDRRDRSNSRLTGSAQESPGARSGHTPTVRSCRRTRPAPPAAPAPAAPPARPDPARRLPGAGPRRRRRADADRAAVDGAALRGLGRADQRATALARRADRPRVPARRRRARRDAARPRRPRGAAPAARRRLRRAGAVPHRQGRRRGPDRRAHRRRRRLRHQAVQPGGGRRPAARPAPAQRRPAVRATTRCSPSAT